MSDDRFTAKQIIEALRKTRGNTTYAAMALGCTRMTIYNYINRYATVKAVFEEEKERTLDKVELKLEDAAINGQPWAIKFILSTKGKDRGYSRRQEITGVDGGPVETKEMTKDKALDILTEELAIFKNRGENGHS